MLVGGYYYDGSDHHMDNVTEYREDGTYYDHPKLQYGRHDAACGAVGQVRRVE